MLHQLHVGHDGAPEGCPADAPQLLAQRGHLRVAHRRERPGRAAAHAADVPLQRLGHALRGDGHGRRPRRVAQGRRGGDPVAHRAPRRDPPLRGPRRRGGHLERGRDAHRGRPRGAGPRHRAHRGCGCAAALEDHRTGGDRARVGVHSDIRADRDGAAAHHQPGAVGVGRPRRRGALGAAQPRRRPRARRADRRRRRGRGAGPIQPRLRRVLGAAGGDGRGARGRVVPHGRRWLPRRTRIS